MPVLQIRDKNGNFIPIPSIKGVDGKSAYEQAQEGGYNGTEEDFIKILNGWTVDGEHFLNYKNPHKVTAEQVSALAIYNGFAALNEAIGTNFNPDTPIETIIAAMPDNTGLKADINTNDVGHSGTSIYPAVYGVLSVYKIRSNRVEVEYVSNTAIGGNEYNKRWIGQYNGGVFGGFVEVYTEQNKPKASDIGALPVEGGEMKGYIMWNGGQTHIFGQGDGNFIIRNYKQGENANDDFLSFHNTLELKTAFRFYRNGMPYNIYGDHNAVDVGISKIKVGTYEGTGTNGTSSNWLANPTVISCDFEPHFVCIYGDGTSSNVGYGFAIKGCSFIGYNETRNIFNAQCNWGSNFIEIGGISADKQANTSGKQYTYFIAGK